MKAKYKKQSEREVCEIMKRLFSLRTKSKTSWDELGVEAGVKCISVALTKTLNNKGGRYATIVMANGLIEYMENKLEKANAIH